MAYSFLNDQTPANGSIAMWGFLNTLITAGWTRVKDSDGTTYSSTGVQVTGSGSGAHGLANASAWMILQHPTLTGFQICVQHHTTAGTHNSWRIQFSRAAGFVTGSPDATHTATASDAQVLCGGGSDASPTFAVFLGTDGAYRMNVCAGGSDTIYPFALFCFPTGNAGGTYQGVWALDMMAAGSFQSADTTPWVMYFNSAGTAAAFGITDMSATGGSVKGYLNLAGTLTWVNIVGARYTDTGATALYPAAGSGSGAGVNSFNAKDNGVPILWARDVGQTAPAGHKGFGTMLRWSSKFRVNMDTVDTVGTKDRVWINGCLVPWGGSTPVV